jgi:sensor histidine kinase YesM
MNFQKTKSIFLICSGYLFWILLDTFFWMYYFNQEGYVLILINNSARLIYGSVICTLFVLTQWRIIKIYSYNHFLSIFVIAAAILFFSIFLALLHNITYRFWATGTFNFQTNRGLWTSIFNCLVLFLSLTGLFYVSYYRNISIQQKEQIARTKALADEAQLLMLRYQINPHFLFNSLNAIQSMIEKDKVRAKEMIADLSDFFRYTLSKNNQTLVPLKEEIDAVQKYLAIQKERFAGRIEIDYETEDTTLKIMLPFFIIHPLVENAIKYGFSADNDVLRLLIKVTRKGQTLSILVKNTGILAPSERITDKELGSTKTGIENIKKRLCLFYPDCSTFELFEKDHWVHALIIITHPSMSV